jgi:hypothetical protein
MSTYNDEEDSTTGRLESQVASILVALDWMFLGGLDEQIVDGAGAAEDVTGRVCRQRESNDDNQHSCAMDIIRNEGRLQTTDESVRDDGNRHQEDGSDAVHASERIDGCRAAHDEHQTDHGVGDEAEDHERVVSSWAVAGLDGLEESMGVGSALLKSDGEGCKEDDLDGGTRGVPEWT